jgi:hypothetical protein
VTARITRARIKHFAGPVALSGLLNLPASTIGAVLRREGMPPLCHLDRVRRGPEGPSATGVTR